MSRLSTMSPAAIKAMFNPDSDDTLVTLVTIYAQDGTTPVVRLADNFTTRISETAEDVVYGVVSRGYSYTFLPIQLSLPSEDDGSAPRCSLTINDVTRLLTPTIRALSYQPRLGIELVLKSTPDTVEVYFSDFYITGITYNASSVALSLEMPNYQTEPFPCYSFTPKYFPGIF